MAARKYFLKPGSLILLMVVSSTTAAATGEEIVTRHCFGCHSVGVMGAPKLGSAEDWNSRLDKGGDTLLRNALEGFNTMPARGGNPALTDAEIRSAVEYMLEIVDLGEGKEKIASVPAIPVKIEKAVVAKPRVNNANRFNRLMVGKSEWNPPPSDDGIHDPDSAAVHTLQSPREAFINLEKNAFGNHVNWVTALENKLIEPRYDRVDPKAQPVIMDLNIVREVKGSMPDVVYPHKQHTEWLDCSNCHPAIFIPQKGANQISMASILMGQQCGVCHGKVAFPVSECRRCHSRKKTSSTAKGGK